jgi:DNA-binding NarL/FixJ family response regulator
MSPTALTPGRSAETGTAPVRLSPRDVQIIRGYADGRTAAGVAAALETTEASVKGRTKRLAKRLGFTGQFPAALVHYAFTHGHLVVVRPRSLRPLPPRMADVLACAARGLGGRATATALGISLETVRTHRSRLHTALGVHCTARAVAVAWTAGLLDHSSSAPTPPGGTER